VDSEQRPQPGSLSVHLTNNVCKVLELNEETLELDGLFGPA
jgi:hypothetical protein